MKEKVIKKYEKIVNRVIYEVIQDEHIKNMFNVHATIGASGVKANFPCLKIQWENDFDYVVARLRVIINTLPNDL